MLSITIRANDHK